MISNSSDNILMLDTQASVHLIRQVSLLDHMIESPRLLVVQGITRDKIHVESSHYQSDDFATRSAEQSSVSSSGLLLTCFIVS